MMRKLIFLAVLTFASQAMALELTMDTVLGTSIPEVSRNLADMGYEVRKSEMEDGRIEIYFVKDKIMGEVYVDMSTGKVTKLKIR